VTGGAVAGVDLGASSGRVVVGHVDDRTVRLEEVHRFPNGPVPSPEGLRWDATALRTEIVEGLRRAARSTERLHGIAIDSWGVDYGLLDEHGSLAADPFHYRDERTAVGVARVHAVAPHDWLYARDGLQFLPFNTLYQLAAEPAERIEAARTIALIPDLVGHWLTGTAVAERTNVSTTGLLDARSGEWAWEIVDRIGLPRRLFPALCDPGDRLGPVTAEVASAIGVEPATEVTHVGSHDTASAVVGVPADGDRFAYVSCGTWGLVGVELDAPILTDESRLAGFTNERGVDGRIRFLRNVSGLWLLQESMRTWAEGGDPEDLDALLAAAADVPAGGPTFDPDDPVFLPPGDMPARIAAALVADGDPAPDSRAGLVRCILDSLAAAFARAVRDASRLSGRTIDTVHLVGGGARNDLLCRLTAEACDLPVVAGPVEATALGNVLVQARTHGWIRGDLDALRARVRATHALRRFEPARHASGAGTGSLHG
jgi:rhamnulokinase